MPATDWGWLIDEQELRGWVLEQTDELLVVNKPPHVVCHPSRHGPWSSLIGACREYLGADVLHMPFRLDRETSGVMILAWTREAGSRLQRAVFAKRFRKTYHAIVCGNLEKPVTVSAAIGRDEGAEFFMRRAVVPEGGEAAETEFVPEAWGELDGQCYTLVRVHPHTGRRHQIRVHAASLGHPLVGDKLYGDDPTIMMQFVREGFSEELLARIPLRRHALHCSEVEFTTEKGTEVFRAPAPPDLVKFLETRAGVTASHIW